MNNIYFRYKDHVYLFQGSIAYVPQQAWIQNATVRDNILLGKPFDSIKYSQIIDACALKYDLDTFPVGEQTEIGEKVIPPPTQFSELLAYNCFILQNALFLGNKPQRRAETAH